MIPFFAPRLIAFDRGIKSFSLEGRCTRVAALSGADLQASDAMAGRERSINIKGTRNTPSYLVNSTLSFFTTRSFSNNSSSSSSVPRAGNLCFSSANSSLFSQTCTTCCTFSFLSFSHARSILASSNDCASSDCKRYSNSLSEDVVCDSDAHVFRTDLISQRRKHM